MPFSAFKATLAKLKNIQFTTWGRYGAAVIAGVCLAFAFPKPGIAGLAWLAPALIVGAALGTRGWEPFRIGYLAGLVHYLTSLRWLLNIPVAGYPILGWIALSAYLALFPAAWVWMMSKTAGTRRAENALVAWSHRCFWALAGAAAWVTMEMLLARLLGGFPWNFLGASQYQLLPLIQVASITGIYGVSFLVVWTSLALFCATREILRQPTNRHAWLGEIIVPATVLVLVFLAGMRTLRDPQDKSRELRVTFVQPSIPQTLIWDPDEDPNRFRQLLDLSTAALTNTTDLLLWPEAAVPDMVRYDEPTREAIADLTRSNHVWMILGSDDAALRPGGTTDEDVDYFNAAFLINPEGEIAASYRKNHLVIFGEFIPLTRWLPFVKWLTPITGGFTPGTKPIPFEFERRLPLWPENGDGVESQKLIPTRVKTATLICFEDVFPRLVRRYVTNDTDFLVNLTNDGWFGESSAQWQHAASALFRAVENGVPLLRCCNNGLTCWVDDRGRIRDIFRDATGSIYGAGFLTMRIPIPEPDFRPAPTFYRLHGDWFGWLCAVFTLLLLTAHLTHAVTRSREPVEGHI